MTDLMHYEKGCSPSAIQRKYSLTYEQGYELAERLKKTQELELELRRENTKLKEYERIVTSYNMKPIDYEIACETVNKLLDDNKRLKHDVGNLGYKIKNQRHEIDNRLKEIEKLKELLTLCYEHLATEASVIPLNIVLKRVWEVLDERK